MDQHQKGYCTTCTFSAHSYIYDIRWWLLAPLKEQFSEMDRYNIIQNRSLQRCHSRRWQQRGPSKAKLPSLRGNLEVYFSKVYFPKVCRAYICSIIFNNEHILAPKCIQWQAKLVSNTIFYDLIMFTNAFVCTTSTCPKPAVTSSHHTDHVNECLATNSKSPAKRDMGMRTPTSAQSG